MTSQFLQVAKAIQDLETNSISGHRTTLDGHGPGRPKGLRLRRCQRCGPHLAYFPGTRGCCPDGSGAVNRLMSWAAPAAQIPSASHMFSRTIRVLLRRVPMDTQLTGDLSNRLPVPLRLPSCRLKWHEHPKLKPRWDVHLRGGSDPLLVVILIRISHWYQFRSFRQLLLKAPG